MNLSFRNRLLGFVAGIFLLYAATTARAQDQCIECRLIPVNQPISLAVGTVRTDSFFVAPVFYRIRLEMQTNLPLDQTECMLGIAVPSKPDQCTKPNMESVLAGEWSVWDGQNIVAQGKIHDNDPRFSVQEGFISRTIGYFQPDGKKQYVVQVKFTKDGTPLNAAKPHLIVEQSTQQMN